MRFHPLIRQLVCENNAATAQATPVSLFPDEALLLVDIGGPIEIAGLNLHSLVDGVWHNLFALPTAPGSFVYIPITSETPYSFRLAYDHYNDFFEESEFPLLSQLCTVLLREDEQAARWSVVFWLMMHGYTEFDASTYQVRLISRVIRSTELFLQRHSRVTN